MRVMQAISEAAAAGNRVLASPHSLEVWLSLHAFLWGIGCMLTAGAALTPVPAIFYVPTNLEPFVGIWPMLTGGIGLMAVRSRKRWWRMVSSAAITPLWMTLAVIYYYSEPPLSGGVVTYGMTMIGEVYVWIRVKHRMDIWADLGLNAITGGAADDKGSP